MSQPNIMDGFDLEGDVGYVGSAGDVGKVKKISQKLLNLQGSKSIMKRNQDTEIMDANVEGIRTGARWFTDKRGSDNIDNIELTALGEKTKTQTTTQQRREVWNDDLVQMEDVPTAQYSDTRNLMMSGQSNSEHMLGSNLADYQNTGVAKHQRKQSPFGAEKPIVSFRENVETIRNHRKSLKAN